MTSVAASSQDDPNSRMGIVGWFGMGVILGIALSIIVPLVASNYFNPVKLVYRSSIEAPATVRFVAKEHFVDDKSTAAAVPMSFDQDFADNFLAKIEENVSAKSIKLYQADFYSDESIFKRLGDSYSITLSQLYELIKHGHSDFVAYVRDAKGVMWELRVPWSADHVFIDAISTMDKYPDRGWVYAPGQYTEGIIASGDTNPLPIEFTQGPVSAVR